MDVLVSRQVAIDAIAKMMPKSYTPDGSHPADEEIFRVQEIFADCIQTIENLPSAQPEIIYCKDCKKHNKIHGRYYDGTFVGMMDCCPLAEIRGAAQGHEFDYQFCAYAEKRGEKDV